MEDEYRVWRSPVVAVVVVEAMVDQERQLSVETIALGWEGPEEYPELPKGDRVIGTVAPPPGTYRVVGNVTHDASIQDPESADGRRTVRVLSPTWALGYVFGPWPPPEDDSEWDRNAVVEWRAALDEPYQFWRRKRVER